jgi:hypothetical protein
VYLSTLSASILHLRSKNELFDDKDLFLRFLCINFHYEDYDLNSAKKQFLKEHIHYNCFSATYNCK